VPIEDVTLPPELEQFAAEAVAAGRYRDTAEVVRAGVDLLRQWDAVHAELLASVLAARDEGDRDGYLTGDEVAARVRATIARRSTTPAGAGFATSRRKQPPILMMRSAGCSTALRPPSRRSGC
jgi:putative addiction module CopG family antidote